MDPQTLTTVFTGGILVATAVGAYFAYQATRAGPRKVPESSLRKLDGSTIELRARKGGPIARNVELQWPGVKPARNDGPTSWPMFSPGQSETIYPVWSQGEGLPWQQRVRVKWEPTHKGDPGYWESAIPKSIG